MKIKNWIRKWLGVDKDHEYLNNRISGVSNTLTKLSEMGVDVNFNSPTKIIIISKIKGGQIRFISAGVYDIKELNRLVERLKVEYGIEHIQYDAPENIRREMGILY